MVEIQFLFPRYGVLLCHPGSSVLVGFECPRRKPSTRSIGSGIFQNGFAGFWYNGQGHTRRNSDGRNSVLCDNTYMKTLVRFLTSSPTRNVSDKSTWDFNFQPYKCVRSEFREVHVPASTLILPRSRLGFCIPTQTREGVSRKRLCLQVP